MSRLQITNLKKCVEEVTHCSIDCCVCGKVEEEDNSSPAVLAAGLYKEGWRYASSEKFQVEGAMCPTCVRTPDADRGEG